jgi:hypothetical protein
MAGSFDIFRKYQRSLLAAVAILAMLAFFVLPPFLQMAPDAGATDPLVATWRGGGIREGELRRAVAMRTVLNQFLRDAIAASGRDPGDAQILGEDEVDVVRTLLLAREAEANGIVIGNNAVNQFLDQWTNKMVRPEQFEALLSGRRLGPMAVAPADVFDALRTVLAADRMRQLSFAGFAGDPPGARWDMFRRLEQQVTVEVVPVVVESLAAEVPAPSEAALRVFFDKHKDALPVDRSPEPGFKEPHRISYDWVKAARDELVAAAEKEVTDAEIEAFYEENKIRLYRSKTPAASEQPAGEGTNETDGAAPAAGNEETKQEEPKEKEQPPATEPRDPKAAGRRRPRVVPVKFRQAGTGEAAAKAEPAAAPAADVPAAPAQEAAAAPAEGVDPLDKVRDDVRTRLATQAVGRRIDGLFQAIAADVSGYGRDLARWKAESGDAATKPVPPNPETIAAKQGLKFGRAEKRTAGEAVGGGGPGATFQLSLDPGAPMGFRQARWIDLFFAAARPLWRTVETRSAPGDRYLSWKTEDVPSFVPEFPAVRADVERAWRIVEARPRARTVAEEIAAAATGGRTLADVAAAQPGTKREAATVGPFTWLSGGGVAQGSPPTLSQPDGLEMPGEEFMRAVFALEPGATAVAFNEPRTVCYAIRLVSTAPPDDELRTTFATSATDRQRLGAVAEREQARAFEDWLAGVERRGGLEWRRPPQRQ